MTIADLALYYKCPLQDNHETNNIRDSDFENTLMPTSTCHPPSRLKKKCIRSAADELEEDRNIRVYQIQYCSHFH